MSGRESLMQFRRWWREDRPVSFHWRVRYWSWGWLGQGWNRLGLGPISIWFGSGPSPVARLRRWFGA